MRSQWPFWAVMVLFGPVFTPVCRADEETAVQRLVKPGGLITRNSSLPGKPVVGMSFQGSTTGRVIREADLACLKGLRHIKVLYLGYVTDTSDAGLAHLKNLTSLEKLMLPETRITDAGLAHLRRLTNLQSPGLVLCKKITGKGLAHLKGMKKLTYVNVAGTQVTDRGAAMLQKALPEVYVTRSFG